MEYTGAVVTDDGAVSLSMASLVYKSEVLSRHYIIKYVNWG